MTGKRRTAVAIAERLCARRLVDGAVTKPAVLCMVALELRVLFSHAGPAEFERTMSDLQHVAEHISAAEVAAPGDFDLYLDAAWEAGIDPSDRAWSFDPGSDWRVNHRDAVIEFWDLELYRAVLRLQRADELAADLCERLSAA